jgi:hypothetical protein
MGKLSMAAAFAAGYVAGAAAGRDRYESIKSTAQKIVNDPRVQDAAQKASDTVSEQAPKVAEQVKDAASSAAATAKDKVDEAADKAKDKVDEATSDQPSPQRPADAAGQPLS